MSDLCKHCGQKIRRYNAQFTNGWIHENEMVGLWCHRTMAEPKDAAWTREHQAKEAADERR